MLYSMATFLEKKLLQLSYSDQQKTKSSSMSSIAKSYWKNEWHPSVAWLSVTLFVYISAAHLTKMLFRSDLSAVDYAVIFTRFNCKGLWIRCYTPDKLDTGHMLLPIGSEAFVYMYTQQGFKIPSVIYSKILYNDLLHIKTNLNTFPLDQLSNFFSTE